MRGGGTVSCMGFSTSLCVSAHSVYSTPPHDRKRAIGITRPLSKIYRYSVVLQDTAESQPAKAVCLVPVIRLEKFWIHAGPQVLTLERVCGTEENGQHDGSGCIGLSNVKS